MKKVLTAVLVIVLCLSYTGCGSAEKTPPACGHESYLSLIALLENGEYESAKIWINDTYGLIETEGYEVHNIPDVSDNFSVLEETVITEPTRAGTVEIKLAPENFLDFFEYAVEYDFTENAFGEVERVMGQNLLRLKPEFVPYFIRGNEIAVEIACHGAWEHGIFDNENKLFIPNVELPLEPEKIMADLTYVIELTGSYGDSPLAGAFSFARPNSDLDALLVVVIDDVLRAKGTLVLSADFEDYAEIQ